MAGSQITVVGRLTADADANVTPQGKNVTNFTVAVNHRKKTGLDTWEDDGADFYRVAAWERHGEHAQNFRKGDEVIVTGRFRTNTYGEDRLSLDITADTVGLIRPAGTKPPTPETDSPW